MALLLVLIALGFGLVLASMLYALAVVTVIVMAGTMVVLLAAAGCAKLYELIRHG